VVLEEEMAEPLLHPHRAILDDELARLRGVVTDMGELVDRAITAAMRGLAERDTSISNKVIAEDALLNEYQRELREVAFTAILTQTPVARDLREIIGLLNMSSEFERMGDHCVSIAKIARNLADLPELKTQVDLPKMAEYCSDQVRGILAAMVARDTMQARHIAAGDDRVDRVYHRLFDDLIQMMTDDVSTVYRATNLVFIAHHLERIADRVTNIAEDLVFLETGGIEELG
jgi:phosphate transport system protein